MRKGTAIVARGLALRPVGVRRGVGRHRVLHLALQRAEHKTEDKS
jgi:hypothetical protein